MKKLPIGIQDFEKIIKNDFLYIDKTEYIYKLIQGSYYFLSRPRRFGKSLLISTLKEIFSGNKELFKDLWIYDKIDWQQYPIIKISFASIDFQTLGLIPAIEKVLGEIAKENNIQLINSTFSQQFKDLIIQLSQKKQVVILIDEYDKPIIDYIDDIEKADSNRAILKVFYSVLKDLDTNIKFLFLTGVSKFSKVSIFSDLNNLNDITIHEDYSKMLGYTQEELNFYFKTEIENLKEKYKNIFKDTENSIKNWYDGYSWDAVNFVYNPFSILKLFDGMRFANYWFATGSPTFLLKMIKNNNYPVQNLKNVEIYEDELDKYEITKITLVPLLFQTGYLTIKSINAANNLMTLDFPNYEVESSFMKFLLTDISEKEDYISTSILLKIEKAFINNDIENFIEQLKILYSGISYNLIDDKEKYYHSLFYLTLRIIGFNIDCEVETNVGRIDAVIKTNTHIYVLEFKMGEAKKAIEQIKAKNYYQKYLSEKKQVVLFGIGFNKRKKNIGDYLIDKIN